MLTLLRHGLEVGAERFHGWEDVDLQDLGVDQAKRAAAYLADVNFKNAYTSDLKRAANTAAIVLENRGLPAVSELGLRSINLGMLQGKPWEEMGEKYNALWDQWKNGKEDLRFPEGESWSEYQGRVYPFLFRLQREAENADVLAVSHSHVIDYAAAVASNGGRPLYGNAIDLVRRFEIMPGNALELDGGRIRRLNYIK